MYEPVETPAFPKGRYNIIYADPPWPYRDTAAAGSRGAAFKYPPMVLDHILRLPVATIAQDDCALFLWATAPNLPMALEVLTSWGFAYKTVAFTWIKTNRLSGKLFWGMGNYTRANAEYVLLGTRGKLQRAAANVHSVIQTPVGEHSAKPPEVRERITQLFGEVSRIELFARERAPGWYSWGAGVDREEA